MVVANRMATAQSANRIFCIKLIFIFLEFRNNDKGGMDKRLKKFLRDGLYWNFTWNMRFKGYYLKEIYIRYWYVA